MTGVLACGSVTLENLSTIPSFFGLSAGVLAVIAFEFFLAFLAAIVVWRIFSLTKIRTRPKVILAGAALLLVFVLLAGTLRAPVPLFAMLSNPSPWGYQVAC